jgi:hypothetical protein
MPVTKNVCPAPVRADQQRNMHLRVPQVPKGIAKVTE